MFLRRQSSPEAKSGEVVMPPEVETPQGCLARASIVVEPYFRVADAVKKNVIVISACPGIESGKGQKVYKCENVDAQDIDEVYLLQVKHATEVVIGAVCHTCPMNPLNRAPEDASALDRLPYDS